MDNNEKEFDDKPVKVKPKKSFKETITLMIRKKWLTNTTQTFLIVVILVAIFLAINLYAQSKDLPEIDVTEHKIYTLSDSSKDVIKKVKKDVKVYLYGIEEDNTLVSLVKQYVSTNDHIKYEILTEENNKAKVEEFQLEPNYQIVVLETAESKKIIDTSYEFYSYDYETGQEVDLTEQVLTNSIIEITADKKPKVYFTTGHDEYALETDLGVLATYLGNESYEASSVNLITTATVPEDCNLLVIMSPMKDFVEGEITAISDYISKGGDMLVAFDVGNLSENYPNLTKIFNSYGVTLNNKGYVYETDSDKVAANYPNIISPEISSASDITSDIVSAKGQLWMVYAGRLTFKSDDELTALGVTKEELLTSSENSLFIKDLNLSAEQAATNAEKGKSVISALMTKTVKPIAQATDDTAPTETYESKLLVIANASFITDYKIQELSSSYPMSYLGYNKDFMLNSISALTDREDTIKIRKDMSTSTYEPTAEQHTVVLAIIFSVPIIIILLGIIIWNVRRRKR